MLLDEHSALKQQAINLESDLQHLHDFSLENLTKFIGEHYVKGLIDALPRAEQDNL
ncbi:hypothetical protein JXA12_00365 [Candidatus Woesearchaeota archaeon]|nr:hypothetical protein [Candidatus Woesearchaeota archaeon]